MAASNLTVDVEKDCMDHSIKTVAVLGGSRFLPGDEVYESALKLGAELAHARFSVLTGGIAA
jgi:predicted Rossmann-fold nucleotide-binding protein